MVKHARDTAFYERDLLAWAYRGGALSLGQIMSLIAQGRVRGFEDPEDVANNQRAMRRQLKLAR